MTACSIRTAALIAAASSVTSELHRRGLLKGAPEYASDTYKHAYAEGALRAARWFILHQDLDCTVSSSDGTEAGEGFNDGYCDCMRALINA